MEVLIPLAFFAMIAAIFVVPRYFKSKEREAMQETIRTAIAKGENLSTETIEAMTRDLKPIATPTRDLRIGIVWLAVAVGISLFGYFVDYEAGDGFYPALGVATIPAIVGLVYLLFAATKLGAPKK